MQSNTQLITLISKNKGFIITYVFIVNATWCTMHIDRTLITHNTNKSHLQFQLAYTACNLHYIIYYEDTIILHSNSVRISDIISSTVSVKGTQI